MSNKRENYVKRRKHPNYLAAVEARKRAGRGGVNDCFRPSNEASKADLAEWHKEELALRRSRQRKRTANGYRSRGGSIAQGNRNLRRISAPHDCAPHEHSREIARRLRQQSARG